MKMTLPTLLLLVQTVFWLWVNSALGVSRHADTVAQTLTVLRSSRAIPSERCDLDFYTQQLQSCQQRLGNCDINVLEPMP